jgi:hypothetical protein
VRQTTGNVTAAVVRFVQAKFRAKQRGSHAPASVRATAMATAINGAKAISAVIDDRPVL